MSPIAVVSRCLLTDLATLLALVDDVDAALDDVVQALTAGTGLARAEIWLLDESSSFVELRAAAGHAPTDNPGSRRLLAAASWIGAIARDGRASAGASGGWWAGGQPLKAGRHALGTLAVYATDGPPDRHVLDQLPAMAAVLSLAIDRKRQESSSRCLQEILDATPDYVTMSPVSGSPLYINPAARRALGIGPHEPVESLLEFRVPGFGSFLSNTIFPAVAADGSWRGETDYVTREGDVLHVSQVSVGHFNRAGDLKFLSTISRDITAESARAEEARRVDERTRFALEAAKAGVWENDLQTGRIIWSETMRAVQGFGAEEFGGTFESFRELVHPADREEFDQATLAATVTPGLFRFKFRTLWPDGSVHWVESHGNAVTDASGRVVRVLGMAQDVSQRENLETSLRQAHRMEALGQLAGGVAHDFNNLLTVILGYGNFLASNEEVPADAKQDVAEIRKAAESATRLTHQLLAFSRKQVLRPNVLSLNELVTTSARMLGRLLGEHFELMLQLDPALLPVKADAGQLEQILVNLAVNARDAMPRGGTVTIRTTNVVLDRTAAERESLTPGRYVCLSVKDTGIGMDEQTKKRIFEPFFTTKEQGKGTGLGLATVFGIVAQSGGAVSVETEPGAGAEFVVRLPAVDVDERSQARDDASGVPRGHETILVVEDNPPVRRLAQITLARLGYRVFAAGTPGEAIATSRNTAGTIHIVVSDIVMPGLRGPELYERLRAERPDLRVLFMSGFAHNTTFLCDGLPPDVAFLAKPFSGPDLGRRVREVLDQ